MCKKNNFNNNHTFRQQSCPIYDLIIGHHHTLCLQHTEMLCEPSSCQVLSHNLCTVMKIPHDPVALEEHFKDDDEGPVSNQGYMPYLNTFILDKVWKPSSGWCRLFPSTVLFETRGHVHMGRQSVKVHLFQSELL